MTRRSKRPLNKKVKFAPEGPKTQRLTNRNKNRGNNRAAHYWRMLKLGTRSGVGEQSICFWESSSPTLSIYMSGELKDKPTSRGRKPKAFRQGNAELNWEWSHEQTRCSNWLAPLRGITDQKPSLFDWSKYSTPPPKALTDEDPFLGYEWSHFQHCHRIVFRVWAKSDTGLSMADSEKQLYVTLLSAKLTACFLRYNFLSAEYPTPVVV